MKRFRILGVALLAVFAVGVVAAASASAEVVVLPGTAQGFTGSGGLGSLETLAGTLVTCTSQTSEGKSEENKPLGTFHIHFLGCKATALGVTAPCASLDHKVSEEAILTLGTYHLVFDHLGASLSEDGVGILFLLEHLHFTCETGIVKILVLVLGEVLCLVKPVNTKAAHFEVTCEQKAKGDPKEIVYWNEAGTEVKMGSEALKTALNEGKEEGSSEVTTATVTPEKEIELMT
jgi:hypothetical protein